MQDLTYTKKRIEIFCAFVIDFNNLNTTISNMLASNNAGDRQRVDKIYEIISSFLVNTKSSDDIIANLNIETADKRTNQLLNYVKTKLNSDKSESFKVLLSHYNTLDSLINPVAPKTITIDELDNDELIKADPNVPISTQDLNFLNKIAKLSMSNTVEIREASKDFKSLNFKNKLDDLYCEKAYYFEQVFSNTDVPIQRKLLDIIKERQTMRKPNDKQVEALKSLKDIGILSDIDTLTLKTSSKVSDHQAFEAFCKILKKNSNPNLIKKILKENIIMTAMFKTNATTISPLYGIKKLFISAQHPYNEVIVKRYMQLTEIDEFQFAELVVELCADAEFKRAYDFYQKNQETKLFLELALDVLAEVIIDEISDLTISRVIQVLKGFEHRENYSFSTFPQERMLSILDDIYYYIVTNELMTHTELLTTVDDYIYARIIASQTSVINPYTSETTVNVQGLLPVDIWLYIHKLIDNYSIDWMKAIYLKFNEINIFSFAPGTRLKQVHQQMDQADAKDLPANESLIVCSDTGSTNFDLYLYDLFTRISKGIFTNQLETTIKRTEGSAFRKKEYPGLSKPDEFKLRKAIMDYITLKAIYDSVPRLFLGVYKRKMTSVIKNITSIESSYEEILEFTNANGITDILNIFKSEEALNKLLKKALRYESSNDENAILKHSEDYFKLID